MIITWPFHRKPNTIRAPLSFDDLNDNLDRLFQDMALQAAAITAKKIDLASADDRTGILPPTSLGGAASPAVTKFYREDGAFAVPPYPSGFISLESSRVSAWTIVTDNVVLRDVGMVSTSAGTSASQKDAGGYWIRRTTVAGVSSSVKSSSTSTPIFWADHNPLLEFTFRTGANISALRYWVGMFSTDPTNADTITGRVLAFRYSTVAPDSGWTTVMRDNTTTTVGSAVGGAVAASTIYRLRVSVTGAGTSVTFTVTDVTNGTTASTTLAVPAAVLGNDLYWAIFLFTNEAVAKIFDQKAVYYEHD